MDHHSSNELLIKDMKHVLTFAQLYHFNCAFYEIDSLRIQSIRSDD